MKLNNLKICVESRCNHVYVPDKCGLCPRCHSEGIWLSKTNLMYNEEVKKHDCAINEGTNKSTR